MAIVGRASASLRCDPIIGIPVYRPTADGVEPWLNLTKAAEFIGVSPKTLAAEIRQIESIHPLSEGPWIFSRVALESSAAKMIAERARKAAEHPTGPDPNQQNLFSSTT